MLRRRRAAEYLRGETWVDERDAARRATRFRHPRMVIDSTQPCKDNFACGRPRSRPRDDLRPAPPYARMSVIGLLVLSQVPQLVIGRPIVCMSANPSSVTL